MSRRLAKTRSQILDETRRIMRDELGIAEDDVDTILRLMHTKLTTAARSLRDERRGTD